MSPKTHSVLAVVDLRLSRPSDKKLSKKDVQTRTTPLTTIYHAGRQVELHLTRSATDEKDTTGVVFASHGLPSRLVDFAPLSAPAELPLQFLRLHLSSEP
jgi:hypothetical protein